MKTPAGYADEQNSQYSKDMEFVLRSTVFQEPFIIGNREHNGYLLNQEIKGNISGFTKDQNDISLVLEVTEINREFGDPKPKEQVRKIQPFVAEVSVSQEDVPYTIDIIKGGIEDYPPGFGLAAQYSTADLILDMMLVTALKKEFTVSKEEAPVSNIIVSITRPERVKIADFPVGPITQLNQRSVLSPNKYLAYPCVGEGSMKGWRFLSLYQDGRNIKYFSRLVPENTDFATRAINLEAITREKMRLSNDYLGMFDVLDDPKQFRTYDFHQLEVADTAETLQEEVEEKTEEEKTERSLPMATEGDLPPAVYVLIVVTAAIVIAGIIVLLKKKTSSSRK